MTKWTEHLMKVYKEMKEKDPTVRLKDAMKKAKESYVNNKSEESYMRKN